jgi:peptide deformylase
VIEAWTGEGQKIERAFSGFHARVIQHEVDHIDGFFYMDRMRDLKHWFHMEEFSRAFGVSVRERVSR